MIGLRWRKDENPAKFTNHISNGICHDPYRSECSDRPATADNRFPISQPLIREGTLAVKLASDLELGITGNEAEAEDLLGAAGMTPRNGYYTGTSTV